MNNLKKLKDNDLETAYSILCNRVEDLKSRGIHQYKDPFPPVGIFKDRHESGFNFGYYLEDQLAAIVTLIPNYLPDFWADKIHSANFLWLTSLFSAIPFSGKGIGGKLLIEMEEIAVEWNFESIYLDCVLGKEDFLAGYYGKFGYKELSRQDFKYPEHAFTAALMKKDL